MEQLAQHNLFLKAEKCQFAVPEVEFLGTSIRPRQVAMDPVKLKGICNWPTPMTVRQVQSFLGFCNFYRWFIEDYSYIARPLIELTKKDRVFKWTSACQHAFGRLQDKFMNEPILQLFDPQRPFQVECDASQVATGAVLQQKNNAGQWLPITYLSHSLFPAEQNYQIYNKELLAII